MLTDAPISPELSVKNAKNFQMPVAINWYDPNKERMNTKIHSHIQLGIGHYIDFTSKTIYPINNSGVISQLTDQDHFELPLGVILFLAINTDIKIDLPKDIKKYASQFKSVDSVKLSAYSDKILRPFQKKDCSGC